MNCPTFCNQCFPKYWAANTPKQMQEHLSKAHNLNIKDPYDLLDYFTKWDDEKQTFTYIGITVKIPNQKSVVILQQMTIAEAKATALRMAQSESRGNKSCKILIVRKQSIPITNADMGLSRLQFNQNKFDAGMKKSVSTHTQKLSENTGVSAIV